MKTITTISDMNTNAISILDPQLLLGNKIICPYMDTGQQYDLDSIISISDDKTGKILAWGRVIETNLLAATLEIIEIIDVS